MINLVHREFGRAWRWLIAGVILTGALTAHAAFAATLSLAPATGVYSAGQIFSAAVLVNTAGQPINAAQGTLTFKPTELRVLSVSKGPIFGLWTADPTFSNSAGTIKFSGGTPSGYTGAGGRVLTITFKALAAGSPRVNFTNGAVLAADGKGTNVLTNMNGGSYTIAAQKTSPKPEVITYVPPANTPGAPVVTSPVFTDFSKWYATTTAPLHWHVPSGITAVRTLLNDSASTIPTKVYNTPISHITLTDLHQGVQYLHLQFKNKDGWGKVANVRLAVDTTNPSSFTIALPPKADMSDPVQTLILKASDSGSGISHYKVQIDGGNPYLATSTASSTVQLPKLEPGHHSVVMQVFDKAGNSLVASIAFDIKAFGKPVFTEYPAQVSANVIPVIKGKTRPDATVLVTVEQLGSNKKTVTVHSDSNGVFMYIPAAKLSTGTYQLTAVATDQYGAQSEPSDPIRIAVELPGYLRIGSLVLSIMSVFVPLVALVILFGLGIWFLLVRLRRFRRGVSRETEEALAMLTDQFARLHTELQAQADALTASRKTKKLTKAEASLIDHMESVLTKAEKTVRKEVTDVEDVVE